MQMPDRGPVAHWPGRRRWPPLRRRGPPDRGRAGSRLRGGGHGLLLAVLVLALLSGCQRNFEPRPAQVSRGAALFAQHCAHCHGDKGIGKDPHNPFGSADPAKGFLAPALNGQGHCSYHLPYELFGLIKHGTGIKGSPMPAWGGRLSDGDIKAIIAYLFWLWPHGIQRLYAAHNLEPLRKLLDSAD
jgi:mono/diheme cytochrome c family protein